MEDLQNSFFFLKGGLDEAILSVLECYQFPEQEDSCGPRHEYLPAYGQGAYRFLLDQFEQHVSTLERSNSLYSDIDKIYKSIELAILIVKTEVNNEFKLLVGNQPMQVRWARTYSRFDCIVYVDLA